MLIAEPSDGQVGRDRVSFFIFPRSEWRPSDLSDDLASVRAASGRAPNDDPRLPLIG